MVGYVSMTLSQASLQAGALAPAVATQMALDPVASLFLGTLAFKETIHADTGALLAALAAFAVMIARDRVPGAAAPESPTQPRRPSSAQQTRTQRVVCERA